MAFKMSLSVKFLVVVLVLFSTCLCEEDQDKTSSVIEATTNAAVKQSGFWFNNLLWNILGYATLVVPFAIVIRIVKNSNFKERGGRFNTWLELKKAIAGFSLLFEIV